MIRTLNRLYWVAYLAVAYLVYLLCRVLLGWTVDDALFLAMSLVFGLVFLAHVGFNISGFALSFSVRQLPPVKAKLLAFHSTGADELKRLTALQWVKAVWAESVASYRLLMLGQPWHRLPGVTVGHKQWKRNKPLPVLLIHGYLCNAGVWTATRSMLDKANISHHAITLEPAIGSIRKYPGQIQRAIDDLLAATGAPQVCILAHSMGGVAARYYVTEYGDERIASMLSLGSPHYGTALSSLGIGKNVRQMAWGSFFLRQLRSNPRDAAFQRKVISLWTPQDNIVCPPASSKLEFARNIAVPGCGHVSLVTHPFTEQLILNWLNEHRAEYSAPMHIER
ncbi:MAG: esterase/lipase family protein [Limnobacter sp.]|uniref:esterase/lipase family protein n=1 Tax=Limnobacter sp. TaxID=2003368 RepID=UPI00391CBF49